jgi:outer membrane lipoprotein-sorting protein
MDTLRLVGQTITDGSGAWSVTVSTNGVQYIVLSYNPSPTLVGASAVLSPV